METEIIDQIVEKAAAAAVARIQSTKVETEQETPEIVKPYGISVSRRFLWPRRYKIIRHWEEQFRTGPNGESVPCAPRLFLQFASGEHICLPNVENRTIRVYPLG